MRKKKPEEHENLERWMVSFADFMTLMFALFVILYANAMSDQVDQTDLRDSIEEAFERGVLQSLVENYRGSRYGEPEVERGVPLDAAPSATPLSSTHNLQGSLSDHTVQLGLVEQNLIVQMPERLLFRSGSADLHPAAFGFLGDVAEGVRGTTAEIRVVGHADAVPLSPGSAFSDNWALSTARAANTVRYLEDRGVSTANLTAAGTVADQVDMEARAVTLHVHFEDPNTAANVAEALRTRLE